MTCDPAEQLKIRTKRALTAQGLSGQRRRIVPSGRRALRAIAALVVVALVGARSADACLSDADCGCDGSAICESGQCAAAFTLPVFPIGAPGAGPYATAVIAVLDHAGGFYTGCCDTEITAFTGEHAVRDDDAVLCPFAPTFPACLFGSCLCGYGSSDGAPFVANGNYVGVVGADHLQYDGHAGYDYVANAGTPLVATRAGMLCKAVADPVNGSAQQPTGVGRLPHLLCRPRGRRRVRVGVVVSACDQPQRHRDRRAEPRRCSSA